MIVGNISLHPYQLALKQLLITAQGGIDKREGVIVCSKAAPDLIGCGDIAPLPGTNRESLEQARRMALEVCDFLQGRELPTTYRQLQQLSAEIEKTVTDSPSVLFGFETMLADLAARQADVPLSCWLNPAATARVPVNALLSGSLSEIKRQLKEKRKGGYPAYKLKVGAASIEEDIARVKLVRELVGVGKTIRLDANRCYRFTEASDFLSQVARYGIEYIEEPLGKAEINRLPELRRKTNVPIAVDESIVDIDMVNRWLTAGAVDVVVIKPTVLGGISRAINLAEMATAKGAKVIITTTMESGVGVAACLQVAAALGETVLPCGLDTLTLLAETLIEQPLTVENGSMTIPQVPGLGVTPIIPNPDVLESKDR
ncbi:MAG: o-succinylbenzoate synthase [candidate division Zixibacteria bacterium]|nr:o-succinylbenzoate synthase [candidate division Zixibacteria bacterium]